MNGFAAKCNMVVCSIRFHHLNFHKAIWMYKARYTTNQIDLSIVLDVGTFSRHVKVQVSLDKHFEGSATWFSFFFFINNQHFGEDSPSCNEMSSFWKKKVRGGKKEGVVFMVIIFEIIKSLKIFVERALCIWIVQVSKKYSP